MLEIQFLCNTFTHNMQIFKEEKTTILSANELFFGNSNNIFSSNTIASEHFTIDAALLVFSSN